MSVLSESGLACLQDISKYQVKSFEIFRDPFLCIPMIDRI